MDITRKLNLIFEGFKGDEEMDKEKAIKFIEQVEQFMFKYKSILMIYLDYEMKDMDSIDVLDLGKNITVGYLKDYCLVYHRLDVLKNIDGKRFWLGILELYDVLEQVIHRFYGYISCKQGVLNKITNYV